MDSWAIKREAALPIWQERIRACRSSGMSVRNWCEENKINSKTYYRWERLCFTLAGQRMGNEASGSQPGQVGTLIKINPEGLPSIYKEDKPTAPSTVTAELVLHCGCVRMDIGSDMSAGKLAELVYLLNHHV